MLEEFSEKVSYLGPETSFTHQAAMKMFPKAQLVSMPDIPEVFKSVENSSAKFGVVPVENSTEGSVGVTLDFLLESGVKIVCETSLDIKHALLSKVGIEEIEKIFSHSQALAQCRNWIASSIPKAELVSVSSTSMAAELASKEQKSAAIASLMTAEKFGLKVLAENIQDFSFNKTRFLVLSLSEIPNAKKNKTTIAFSTMNKAGALFNCIKAFKVYDINLTKIESRPSKKNAWEYVFFVDFEGDAQHSNSQKALEELKENCIFFKTIGSFPLIQ